MEHNKRIRKTVGEIIARGDNVMKGF